jgi:hypothetical protein
MVVSKNTEYYLVHEFGLSKKEIKDMLPSEIKEHNQKIIRKWLDQQKVFVGTIGKK